MVMTIAPAAPDDTVLAQSAAPASAPNLGRSLQRRVPRVVMPRPWQLLEQSMPNLVMAFSALASLLVMSITPANIPVWAIVLVLPTILLLVLTSSELRPRWHRAAWVNLAAVTVVFPLLVVRQSVLRIPFVDASNGTLLVPTVITLGVMVALIVLAVASAILSEEDPEYAGVVFLPAAMMVPFLAGTTAITSLPMALSITMVIFFAAAALTVIASMLSWMLAMLVAPVAIGLQFIILTLVSAQPIFPLGAGMTARILFVSVVLLAVVLTVAVPAISIWWKAVKRQIAVSERMNPSSL